MQEQQRFDIKHIKQLEELRATAEGTIRYFSFSIYYSAYFIFSISMALTYFFLKFIRELEQLQNEKRKALLEHETAKLRECDEALQREIREWRGQLHPRKQVCFP